MCVCQRQEASHKGLFINDVQIQRGRRVVLNIWTSVIKKCTKVKKGEGAKKIVYRYIIYFMDVPLNLPITVIQSDIPSMILLKKKK